MVHYNSVTAWINTDGKPLEEHGVEVHDDAREVSCWVPSEPGKTFSVHLRHKQCPVETGIYVFVDGQYAGGGSIHPSSLSKKDYFSLWDVAISATTARKLMFANVRFSDDDDLLDSMSSATAELGEIRIEHWEVAPGPVVPFHGHPYQEVGLVHERSKKGIAHYTQLGDPESVSTTTTHFAIQVKRLLTVVFRYRPFDVLQADGTAPPPARFAGPSSGPSRKRKLTSGQTSLSEEEPTAGKEQSSEKTTKRVKREHSE
ncbi:hypothetical protein BDZ89DRAFT_1131415 [Hymenopellis radicata]|nr:hypothetical protein BDZ89DRAFT_1131415 [Hymenopellis radicata]